MSSHLLVERALALIPDGDEFLPLSDALIGTSFSDAEKRWARSSAYVTIGKRIADPGRVAELIPGLVEKSQRRLQKLYSLVIEALEHQKSGDLAAAADTLIRAGEVEEADRSLEKAEKIYSLALGIARDLRDKQPQILVLRRLGRVSRTASRLSDAWQWYEQSYQLSLDQLDFPGQVIACQGLGNVCGDRGQADLARAWYERGLRLARGLDDHTLIWPFYTNLSILSRWSGNLQEAETFLARGREHIEAAGGGAAMLFWRNSKGAVLMEHGDAAAAEQVYREALAQTEDPFWELTLRVNIGLALVAQGRLFEAEAEARRAEEIGILHRLITDLVDVYDLLGVIARERCDEDGFVFYEQALQVCRERNLPPVKEALLHYGYGRLHRSCGRSEEAIAYLTQARDTYHLLGLVGDRQKVERELASLNLPAQAENPGG